MKSCPFEQFYSTSKPIRKAGKKVGVAAAKSDLIISDVDMIPGPEFVQAHYTAYDRVKMLVVLKDWHIIWSLMIGRR